MGGLSENLIKQISESKSEPKWVLDFRLKALEFYRSKEVPTWGVDLSGLDESKIKFFEPPETSKKRSWGEVPIEMKKTFDKLKIPEAERKFLAGVETQYDSNVVYGKLKKELAELGVVFCSIEEGIKNYPELIKKWFGRIIPYSDNKYAALNAACFSGGSFVYVPKGVKVKMPLQAYFYIQTQSLGQFERTLIIADEGASVHYVEGCSAPTYSDSILHSGVIELIAMRGAKIRYTTIQNWSKNVYNLVTQRGLAFNDATIEWIDCNIGSFKTMKYPCVILQGDNAHGEVLSIAVADKNQHIDSGAKMIHSAKNTSSIITTKSISKNGGRASYRGKVRISKGARNSKSKVKCDALILDDISRTDTYPKNEVFEKFSKLEHEATVSKISENQLWYLGSHGLSEEEASGLIVAGFIEPISKELPLEYAMELNELIKMEMIGSVG